MSDVKQSAIVWGKRLGASAKRHRPNVSFEIAVDYDGHDTIDLTPSHQISELPGAEPQRVETSAPASSTQASNMATTPTNPCLQTQHGSASTEHQLDTPMVEESERIRKWQQKDWDADVFDSDQKDMSITVLMDLAIQLSLLKEYLELYRQFNVRLGDIVSGPRHTGFISAIFSTVTRIESCTTHLRMLRDEKQRGNPEPGALERIAERIARRCKTDGKHVWEVMEEKVDMTDERERGPWVKRKKAVLGEVMEGMVECLEGLDRDGGWKEVREMQKSWDRRWKAYGAMDTDDLKDAGWIL